MLITLYSVSSCVSINIATVYDVLNDIHIYFTFGSHMVLLYLWPLVYSMFGRHTCFFLIFDYLLLKLYTCTPIDNAPVYEVLSDSSSNNYFNLVATFVLSCYWFMCIEWNYINTYAQFKLLVTMITIYILCELHFSILSYDLHKYGCPTVPLHCYCSPHIDPILLHISVTESQCYIYFTSYCHIYASYK